MRAYCERAPTDSLAEWVECGWVLESCTAVTGHRVPPDGCLDIVYDRRNGLRAIGAMTIEQQFDYPESACVAGIRFRPGMAGPFLRISAAELTDGSTPLEELWPRRARELARQLDDAQSIRDAMRLLLGHLRRPIEEPNAVQRAIRAMAIVDGNADLDKMAYQANLSPRQFRRRCLEESGLTPKFLCRVLRFQRAYRAARVVERPNWSSVALEANYFDQAHFIRDFRKFTGVAPMAVFSNTRSRRRD